LINQIQVRQLPSVFQIPLIPFQSASTSEIMKVMALDKVKMKEVQMEGATGAWRQLPIGSTDGHIPYHNHPYEHMN
jgi:hypothetical protein